MVVIPNPDSNFFLLVVLCGASIGLFGGASYMSRLQMKFIATAKGYDAMIRRVNDPTNLFFQYNNIRFLGEKGYVLKTPSQLPRDGFKYDNWRRIASIETQKSFDEFRADCKKGNVNSEIIYQFDSLWSQREITKEVKLYWHKQKCDKLA